MTYTAGAIANHKYHIYRSKCLFHIHTQHKTTSSYVSFVLLSINSVNGRP